MRSRPPLASPEGTWGGSRWPNGRVRSNASGLPKRRRGLWKNLGMRLGILGGTGPAGRGLAARFGAAGHEVVLGSRDGARAAEVAAGVVEGTGGRAALLSGAENAGAAQADLVIVATPFDSTLATIAPLRDQLEGKVVVSMVNALHKHGREMLALYPTRGSVAAMVQAVLPTSMVVASFHHLPAGDMENLDSGLDADVLACSDHPEATTTVVELVNAVAGLRGLDCGSLAQASALEAFTAVAITLNMRYKAHSTVKMAGI